MTHPLRVVIIGTGFAGLGAAIRLREQHPDLDLVLLERADAVGGTWRDNTYPGAACDIPSHLYSFSFEPNADWTRAYAPQAEIRAYLESCVERYALRPLIRFGVEVTELRFDEASATWRITARDGSSFEADVVVGGLGALRDPAYPRIEGREDFAGAQMHTARWDHGVDLHGARVGVIGTGASAIQVVPEVAQVAGHLTVFQRTPAWVLPRGDQPYSPARRRRFARQPLARLLHRAMLYTRQEAQFVFFAHNGLLRRIAEAYGRAHLRRAVRDPAVRAQLTPDYRIGCKRILLSDDYLPTFERDDVTLETRPIARVTPRGIELTSGEHVDLDVIIWATGFSIDRPLGVLDAIGVGGARLSERWAQRPSAHLGATVPDFPNLFLVGGPNTGLGHNSIILMLESQIDYLLGALEILRARPGAALAPRPEVHDAFVAELDRRHRGLAWASGCDSWYLNDRGENFTIWPGTTYSFRRRTAHFDPAEYEVVPARKPVAMVTTDR